MFAARAGARKVIGMDMSNIISKAKKIVETNGLDSVISLVKGKVEEVDLPISEKVGVFLLVIEKGGRYHLRMDGLFSIIRIDAEYCSICKR